MKEQTYSTHSRWVMPYHLVTFLAILALLIGSIINYMHSAKENLYSASLLILTSVIILLMFYFLRAFALKAQDRAIRAEEKLRFFILTGKPISSNLTTRQIVGLRFAPDEEFVALAEKAEKEQLSEKEIKKLINHWKPDLYRV